MKIADLLWVTEKIELGIRDAETTVSHFDPLWQNPLLLEAFKSMLQAFLHDKHSEDYRKSFEVVCHWMSPEFHEIFSKIKD